MLTHQEIEQAINALENPDINLEESALKTCLTILNQHLADLKQREIERLHLHGERKQVTVMFADISGFTAMSEKLDPEEVRNLINACFEQLGMVIDRYEGHIDKFIGDEIMALFGAPIAHENDPERALRAALDMMTLLETFNQEHADKIPKPLRLHFGINTGLVIAGGIGTQQRQDYSVMGDPVNLASRLEGLSETGEILVGEVTYRLTASLFEFEALKPMKVKGKEQPVQIYRLLRAKRLLGGQLRGVEGLVSPLIGRDEEMEQLKKILDKLRKEQGGIVSIMGDAGIGKTRLVSELRRKYGQEEAAKWVKGRAVSHAQNASYFLIRQLFMTMLNISPEAPAAEVDSILRAEMEELSTEQTEEIYPYLATLLEVPLDEKNAEQVKYLEGEALRQRIVQAVQNYILLKTKQIPLILAVDDLHWADPSSLELLESLLPLTQKCRLLLLLIYRPRRETILWDFHKKAQEVMGEGHQCIKLSPLNYSESKHLLSNLLGFCNIPAKIQQAILTKSEGNPFFVEEVIRSLIDNGALTRSENDKGWMASAGVEDITIPDTLQGVVMARIDRLDHETKRILQIAAVIGRTFSHKVLDKVINS